MDLYSSTSVINTGMGIILIGLQNLGMNQDRPCVFHVLFYSFFPY